MSNATHTLGPWDYFSAGSNMKKYTQPFGIKQSGETNLIAGCFGDVRGGEEVARSNAMLIAAAPDLLEALELVDREGIDWQTVQVMRRAIAKAKGKIT